MMTNIDGDRLKISLGTPTLIVLLSAIASGTAGGTWWLSAQQRGIAEAQTQAVQNSRDLAELRKISTDLATAQASAAINQTTTSLQYAVMKDNFTDLRDRVKALEARRP